MGPNDDDREHEVFDAKLRALLAEPPNERARTHGRDVPLRLVRRAVPVAAAAVLLSLWVFPAEPLDDAAEAPVAAQGGRTTATPAQIRKWVSDLDDADRRTQAMNYLIAAGKPAAEPLADWLAKRKPTRSTPALQAALDALNTMGPAAAHIVPRLQTLATEWPAIPCAELLHTLGTLAAWHKVALQQRGMSAGTFDILGVEKAIPDPLTASTIYRATQRLRSRTAIVGKHDAASLSKHLKGSAWHREAALDVLLHQRRIPPSLLGDVESIFLHEQPQLSLLHWNAQGKLKSTKTEFADALRDHAAWLLLRHRRTGAGGVVASAYAWRLLSPNTTVHRPDILEIGKVLALESNRSPARVEYAIGALLRTTRRPGFAGDAIVVLGQIGRDSKRVRERLTELANDNDQGLAKRAKAALRMLR